MSDELTFQDLLADFSDQDFVGLPYPFATKSLAGIDFIQAKVDLKCCRTLPLALALINHFDTDLYENAVVPIALANKYTAISLVPGGRFIDILAVDVDGNYVVIELKVSRGYDRVVGQLLRYIAWIERDLADEGKKVRGIIIAREISHDLILACSRVSDVELFEYELSVSLRRKNMEN